MTNFSSRRALVLGWSLLLSGCAVSYRQFTLPYSLSAKTDLAKSKSIYAYLRRGVGAHQEPIQLQVKNLPDSPSETEADLTAELEIGSGEFQNDPAAAQMQAQMIGAYSKAQSFAVSGSVSTPVTIRLFDNTQRPRTLIGSQAIQLTEAVSLSGFDKNILQMQLPAEILRATNNNEAKARNLAASRLSAAVVELFHPTQATVSVRMPTQSKCSPVFATAWTDLQQGRYESAANQYSAIPEGNCTYLSHYSLGVSKFLLNQYQNAGEALLAAQKLRKSTDEPLDEEDIFQALLKIEYQKFDKDKILSPSARYSILKLLRTPLENRTQPSAQPTPASSPSATHPDRPASNPAQLLAATPPIPLETHAPQSAYLGAPSDCSPLPDLKERNASLLREVQATKVLWQSKSAECEQLPAANRSRCTEETNGLRKQGQALETERRANQTNLERQEALCPDSRREMEQTLQTYRQKLLSNVDGRDKAIDSEKTSFEIAALSYRIDQANNLAADQLHEREMSAWRNASNTSPEPPAKPKSFSLALDAHRQYLAQHPHGLRRDMVLYRTAFILDLDNKPDEILPLLKELVQMSPRSGQYNAASLRLGEWYFQNKLFDTAITYYNSVETKNPTSPSIVELSMYHKAEARYALKQFETAATDFLAYLESTASVPLRKDLRSGATLYLGASLAGIERQASIDSILERIALRPYLDTVTYELAIALAELGQTQRATGYLKGFADRFPDYFKAPFAQIKLVELLVKLGQADSAALVRLRIAREYAADAPWWNRHLWVDSKELERIKSLVTKTMASYPKASAAAASH